MSDLLTKSLFLLIGSAVVISIALTVGEYVTTRAITAYRRIRSVLRGEDQR